MVVMFACAQQQNPPNNGVSYPEFGHSLTTKELSEAYCGSCHLYPDPMLLPKSVWEGRLLKDMGRRLGIVEQDYDPFDPLTMYDAFVVRQANIYPKDSLISVSDWERIYEYYLDQSPERPVAQPSKPELELELPLFDLKVIDQLPAYPLSTMVKIDTAGRQIYWGSRAGDLMIIDSELNLTRQLPLESPPSQVLIDENNTYVLTMGVMDPSEEAKGKVQSITGRVLTTHFSGLQRPVHMTTADVDGNGSKDFLVSQFGNYTGKISWFSKGHDGEYRESVLKSVPGAVRSEIVDLNMDGRLDIVVLFGQGDERISVFLQAENGDYQEQLLLRFPPVYGSTSFELKDFNDDGLWDILYTNGDNADFSYGLKSFHGVRIYLNTGNLQFEESFFYPLFGATNAKARDFDQDGDLDFFTICFFPDFNSERPEGFVYFENKGNGTFKGYTIPEDANGRWLVADTGDFDGDGDEDIVLGSLLFKINAAPQHLIENWTQNGYQMVVLENTSIR